MHRRLRHFARAPHFRVLAWLAWLILAVTPVHGASDAMMVEAKVMGAMPSAMQMADHAMHDTSAATADCCAGQAPHDRHAMNHCHCAATCVNALPVLAMAELAAVPMDAIPVPHHGAVAPSIAHSPPLRPPLLQTSRLT